jgi:hypothetical protein
MEPIIAPCGNDCSVCPRYTARSTEDLQKVSELWYRAGWRDRIVSVEEIGCTGCTRDKTCPHGIIECINKKEVESHHQCEKFPCGKIKRMLKKMKQYDGRCRKVCTEGEFEILKKAFFEKDINIV